jgi:hypothetical protein
MIFTANLRKPTKVGFVIFEGATLVAGEKDIHLASSDLIYGDACVFSG